MFAFVRRITVDWGYHACLHRYIVSYVSCSLVVDSLKVIEAIMLVCIAIYERFAFGRVNGLMRVSPVWPQGRAQVRLLLHHLPLLRPWSVKDSFKP